MALCKLFVTKLPAIGSDETSLGTLPPEIDRGLMRRALSTGAPPTTAVAVSLHLGALDSALAGLRRAGGDGYVHEDTTALERLANAAILRGADLVERFAATPGGRNVLARLAALPWLRVVVSTGSAIVLLLVTLGALRTLDLMGALSVGPNRGSAATPRTSAPEVESDEPSTEPLARISEGEEHEADEHRTTLEPTKRNEPSSSVARNPRATGVIAWRLLRHVADGAAREWLTLCSIALGILGASSVWRGVPRYVSGPRPSLRDALSAFGPVLLLVLATAVMSLQSPIARAVVRRALNGPAAVRAPPPLPPAPPPPVDLPATKLATLFGRDTARMLVAAHVTHQSTVALALGKGRSSGMKLTKLAPPATNTNRPKRPFAGLLSDLRRRAQAREAAAKARAESAQRSRASVPHGGAPDAGTPAEAAGREVAEHWQSTRMRASQDEATEDDSNAASPAEATKTSGAASRAPSARRDATMDSTPEAVGSANEPSADAPLASPHGPAGALPTDAVRGTSSVDTQSSGRASASGDASPQLTPRSANSASIPKRARHRGESAAPPGAAQLLVKATPTRPPAPHEPFTRGASAFVAGFIVTMLALSLRARARARAALRLIPWIVVFGSLRPATWVLAEPQAPPDSLELAPGAAHAPLADDPLDDDDPASVDSPSADETPEMVPGAADAPPTLDLPEVASGAAAGLPIDNPLEIAPGAADALSTTLARCAEHEAGSITAEDRALLVDFGPELVGELAPALGLDNCVDASLDQSWCKVSLDVLSCEQLAEPLLASGYDQLAELAIDEALVSYARILGRRAVACELGSADPEIASVASDVMSTRMQVALATEAIATACRIVPGSSAACEAQLDDVPCATLLAQMAEGELGALLRTCAWSCPSDESDARDDERTE